MNMVKNSSATLIVLLCLFCTNFDTANAQSPDHVIHVATVGENHDGCGSPKSPCKTIQHAINRAANEQWVKILVAGGVYVDDPNDYNVCDELQIDAVVCNVNKQVEMIGGFSPGNWADSNPEANPTVIDGQNQRRGVMALNVSRPENYIDLDGFTIRNGRATGIPRLGGDNAISGFGGGMFTDGAGATLKNVRFENNLAVGDNQGAGHGGTAAGGGLAVRAAPSEVRLENIVFKDNRSEGGNGVERGGYAVGGGFYSYKSRVVATNIFAEGNVARAGQASGSGVDGIRAMSDAQGAGLAFQYGSDVIFENIQVVNNTAIGGSAPNGQGGGAYGGGIFAELASNIELRDAVVRGNLAQGGDGANNDPYNSAAGHARGGGIEIHMSPATIERFTAMENSVRGGTGQTYKGGPGGGGIALVSYSNHRVTMTNCVVTDNQIEMGGGQDASFGGGGGGLWIQGVNATLDHCTIARNTLEESSPLFGPAMVFIDTVVPWFEVILRNSIVAQHQTSADRPTIDVQANAALRLNNVVFAENTGPNYVIGTSVTGPNTERTVASVGFVAPGPPAYDYRLQKTSPAVNGSPHSTLYTDRDNLNRDSAPDTGAYEHSSENAVAELSVNVTASSKNSLHVSWGNNLSASSYRMTVSCSGNAARPAEGACDVPFSTSTDGAYDLTELTPYANYGVSMEGLDHAGSVVAQSPLIETYATDHLAYIPIVSR